MTKSSRIAVIGAGISGVSVARMLLDSGYEVDMFEQSSKPGGLIRCDRVEGNLYHLVGGHVFNSKNQRVLDWFWRHFDRDSEFIAAKRNAKVWINDSLVGYPIENHLFQFPAEIVQSVVEELLALQLSIPNALIAPNFESFLKCTFGETLYQLYFKPYNEKIWQTDLSNVPLAWLEGKLPMPIITDILLSNIIKKEESDMVHSSFFYPKSGGSQFIIDRIATGIIINSDVKVTSLELVKAKWQINGSGNYDHMIYTGDVRKLSSMIKAATPAILNGARKAQNLLSNGTTNALCETDDNDLSWLYIPDPAIKAHRIIYTGNFAPSNNNVGGRKTCTVEFSGKVDESTVKSTLPHLPGNLKMLAIHHESNSYVIHQHDTKNNIYNLNNSLQKVNFHLLGRFAEWEYYNMDKCMERAMEISEDIQKVR